MKNHDEDSRSASGGGRFPLLYQLVYCSRAATGVSDTDVDHILDCAHRHNPLHDITGLLVFSGGVFGQWLEGPRDAVVSLMAKLRTDPRHDTIVTLTETESYHERMFPSWDMELVSIEEIHELLMDSLKVTKSPASKSALNALLQRIDLLRH